MRTVRRRDQCVRADAILTALLTSEQRLTEQNIKSIDREANNLTSPLTVHIVPDNEYLLITETAEDLKIKENKMFEPPSLHEVNVAEDIEVKNEDDDNTFFDDEPNFDDNMEPAKINDTDQIESNYEENDNFIPSDDSSCDSIPINQLKKAKLKKKKEEKKPAKKVAKVRKKAVKKDPTEPKIDRRRKPFLNEDLNETLFTIIDLTYEEQIAEIEKRQESSNYKNAVYKCTECYKGFLDEDAYETHMVRHTDACGEYTCKICKTHFKQPHALRKHITAHHTHRFSCNCCVYVTTHRQVHKHITAHHTHRFSCNCCVYVTTHRQTARLHERWHKGTKYQCPHCPEEFVRFTTYMGHVRIKHPSDFVCARCGYSFVSAKGIELHKKLKHRLEDQPIPADGPLCSLCNIRFATEDARQRHMQVSLRHAADKYVAL
ncbi:unnamed protein product [Plutella xylostella]|uniref:(diamondback moth) hypothetical protein n=1 Tax=Plutella xylostella TaxID=51655 RepID=A0A8S4F0C3_PLUXY|nr:unnamed protein product [Plutella xylostella]